MLDVGVDVGGTFTDFTFADRISGELWVKKVPSTPDDLTSAVLTGLKEVDLRTVNNVVHGTTVALNSILQRAGAETALLTTAGFRDHIEIGDTLRYTGGLFDHKWVRTKPYPVPPARRYTVNERTSSDGVVDIAVDESELEKVAVELEAEGVEALAICFLNSYMNERNEGAAERFLAKRLPGLHVSVSSTNPEFREYPRFITGVFNAFISPVVSNYLANLRCALADAGYHRDVLYMTSAGGIITENAVVREPMRLVFGAPAGGVTASTYLASLKSIPNIATFDMGGTSTDVGFVDDYRTQVKSTAQLDAFPIALPSLDIKSIGAGGGSIAYYAPEGTVQVGPRSAGAVPGPACYGRGGDEFTVTDANLLLGRIGERSLLGGEMKLDRAAAEQAARALAMQAGIDDIYELAAGVVEICNIQMYGALREVSIERGKDPEDLVLVAFGGAGGLHAIPIAERLNIPRVLIPQYAGIFSSLGLLVADRRLDLVRHYTLAMPLARIEEVLGNLKEMASTGRDDLISDGADPAKIDVSYLVGLRYQGQVSEEQVIFHEPEFTLEELGERFGEIYEEKYNFRRAPQSAEIVSLRVVVTAETVKAPLRRVSAADDKSRPGQRRSVYFRSDFEDCPIWTRDALTVGEPIEGPAIVEEYDSTTAVFPGWLAEVDEFGSMTLVRSNTEEGVQS